MVAFATLFLGLVLGPQAVDVEVEGPVARLEIRLDGRLLAERGGPPWSFLIDFGDAYEPHVLEAVAFDAAGAELGRAEQWLNVPRREVEAELVLARGPGGEVVAKLLWESRVDAMPEEVSATFDGRPIRVTDPEHIVLPAHDPRRLHLLQVELRFPGDFSALVEKTFGGAYTDEVETQLTAVPIELPRGSPTPEASAIRNHFVGVDGRPLEVVAVDEGPAELIVVRDAGAQDTIDSMTAIGTQRTLFRRGGGGVIASGQTTLRYTGQLRRNQIARFLYPTTVELLGHRTRQEQFPTSRSYAPADGGLAWLMARERREIDPAGQRLTEAVAVAGMAAALRNRRRAVLLVLGSRPADVSRIQPEAARTYLATLRVPLVVWALEDRAADGPWGPQRPIRNLGEIHRATRDLSRLLERQRIVWLRGRHLPQRIALLERADFALAR